MAHTGYDGSILRRNDKCGCGSGDKFKRCCMPGAPTGLRGIGSARHIDMGEQPVRWVICDESGTHLFADKDNRALVFKTKEEAAVIARLEEFKDQRPGEINVSGVGETKWAHLQEKIPFVDIDDIEVAIALVKERIEHGRQNLETS